MRILAVVLLSSATLLASPAAPIRFERNDGQTAKQVRFFARGSHSTLFLTQDSAVISSPDGVSDLRFAGTNPRAQVSGQDLQPGFANYLIGNSQEKWHTHIPTYGRVSYKDVYPGVDLVFYATENQFEYDLVLSPGSDPSCIQLNLSGRPTLTANGDITAGSTMVWRKPVVYQGRTKIAASYVLRGNTVSFRLGPYDHQKSLVIDPVLSYSTYLGGSDDEGIFGIKLDHEGNIYLAGETSSIDFPLENPEQPKIGGDYDAFVTKLDPTGHNLIYSTFLGGSGYDHAVGLELGSSGDVYLAGMTQSVDFPTARAIQPTLKGSSNAFVARLDSSGSKLIFSTYLGGTGYDQAADIGLDQYGNVYITGSTNSVNFPVTSGAYSTQCDQGMNIGFCEGDAFVSKISASGSALTYSTYLGGTGSDNADGIAIGYEGDAYISGQTSSSNFPTKAPYQAKLAGQANAFVTVLNTAGSGLIYSSYLGGNGDDSAMGIALDSDANIYLTGITTSTNFPALNPYQSTNQGGGGDGFITKLTAHGQLSYSTYLGGTGMDFPFRIAVDQAGEASIIGFTGSLDFPVQSAVQPGFGGGTLDAFVTQLSATGQTLNYSTYLGGTGDEYGYTIHSDKAGNIWVGGSTSSTDYPLITPFQDGYAGGPFDAFLSKISRLSDGEIR